MVVPFTIQGTSKSISFVNKDQGLVFDWAPNLGVNEITINPSISCLVLTLSGKSKRHTACHKMRSITWTNQSSSDH